MRKLRIEWVKSTPFLLMHLAVFTAFLLPFQWKWVALCVASYYVRMFAITAGYHRYFSHRSYKMNRLNQFLMACLGSTAMQKGVLWWAGNHRHHHRHSDQPNDIHSPIQQGFWWSHIGWVLSKDYVETRWELVQDLSKFPELRWLNRYHLVPGILYGVLFFLLGGWNGLVWGYVISTVLLWHGTFTINSLSHVFGTRRYRTSDTSKNNFLLALITLGEGWHNNHHCYMSSANQGFFWWEIDGSYYVLKIMSWFKLTYDLRKPPLKLLETKLLKVQTMSPNPSFKLEERDYLERA